MNPEPFKNYLHVKLTLTFTMMISQVAFIVDYSIRSPQQAGAITKMMVTCSLALVRPVSGC